MGTVDLIVVGFCLLALMSSFWLLVNCPCQHTSTSFGGMRCPDCGMSWRQITVNRLIGYGPKLCNWPIDRRGYKEVSKEFWEVHRWLKIRLVEFPASRPNRFIEEEYLPEDAPQHVKDLWEGFQIKRMGALAYYLKKWADTTKNR